jgi:uncharacterized protein YkwD
MRLAAVSIAVVSSFLLTFAGSASARPSKARLDDGERAIVRAVNGIRARHGLPSLRVSRALARAADGHSANMLANDFFAHGSMAQRVRRYVRSRAIGETLAWTPSCSRSSARRVVRMWMNSSGHRAVLLSRRYRKIGVARRAGRLGSARACVVTADFASRR